MLKSCMPKQYACNIISTRVIITSTSSKLVLDHDFAYAKLGIWTWGVVLDDPKPKWGKGINDSLTWLTNVVFDYVPPTKCLEIWQGKVSSFHGQVKRRARIWTLHPNSHYYPNPKVQKRAPPTRFATLPSHICHTPSHAMWRRRRQCKKKPFVTYDKSYQIISILLTLPLPHLFAPAYHN